MPERNGEEVARRRSIWSGTITFGLVSIPVDLLSAIRARQTSMRMVDTKGRALGREYVCPADGKTLSGDEIVRGYETDDGKMVVVTDEELDAIAPELSRDIELRRFVPLEQIPPAYYLRPYFLAPAGRSVKAYHLLATVMEKGERTGIATFVMRDHEYLVAIFSKNGLLVAEALRFEEEVRDPEALDLPKKAKPDTKLAKQFEALIAKHAHNHFDPKSIHNEHNEALRKLAEAKAKKGKDIVEAEGAFGEEGGEAETVDLMRLLKQSLQ